jgi:hypothetical protein
MPRHANEATQGHPTLLDNDDTPHHPTKTPGRHSTRPSPVSHCSQGGSRVLMHGTSGGSRDNANSANDDSDGMNDGEGRRWGGGGNEGGRGTKGHSTIRAPAHRVVRVCRIGEEEGDDTPSTCPPLLRALGSQHGTGANS